MHTSFGEHKIKAATYGFFDLFPRLRLCIHVYKFRSICLQCETLYFCDNRYDTKQFYNKRTQIGLFT